MNDKITIEKTPRASAYLSAVLASYNANRLDVEKAIAADREARRRAADKGETHHGLHHLEVPPELTEEEIAARIFERGAALVLNEVTGAKLQNGRYQMNVGHVGGCGPLGLLGD